MAVHRMAHPTRVGVSGGCRSITHAVVALLVGVATTVDGCRFHCNTSLCGGQVAISRHLFYVGKNDGYTASSRSLPLSPSLSFSPLFLSFSLSWSPFHDLSQPQGRACVRVDAILRCFSDTIRVCMTQADVEMLMAVACGSVISPAGAIKRTCSDVQSRRGPSTSLSKPHIVAMLPSRWYNANGVDVGVGKGSYWFTPAVDLRDRGITSFHPDAFNCWSFAFSPSNDRPDGVLLDNNPLGSLPNSSL
jgi:hypothetical protein